MSSQELAKTKEQVLSDLFAIRAGLSMISNYNDKIREEKNFQKEELPRIEKEKESQKAIEAKVTKLREKLSSVSETIPALEKNLERSIRQKDVTEEEIKKKKEEIKNGIEKKRTSRLSLYKDKLRIKFSLFPVLVYLFLGGIASLIAFLFSYFDADEKVTSSELALIIILGIIPITFYALFLSINSLNKRGKFKKLKEEYEATVIDYDAELQKWLDKETKKRIESIKHSEHNLEFFKKEADVLSSKIEQAEKELKNITDIVDEDIASYDTKIQKSNQNISDMIAMSKAINQALLETYSSSVSESDWGNIDLIVHYLETGRADSLKEALIQLDRQLQNEMLIKAMQQATESINMHIESAFTRMGMALAESFSRLEGSIHSLRNDIIQSSVESRNLTAELVSEIAHKIDDQVSITEMNNALLQKANKSSEALLDDLRYNQRFWIK